MDIKTAFHVARPTTLCKGQATQIELTLVLGDAVLSPHDSLRGPSFVVCHFVASRPLKRGFEPVLAQHVTNWFVQQIRFEGVGVGEREWTAAAWLPEYPLAFELRSRGLGQSFALLDSVLHEREDGFRLCLWHKPQ